jgi:hypothetical protein
MSKKKFDRPVLIAEDGGEDCPNSVRVWCPFCVAYHYHGKCNEEGVMDERLEGHRVAHCHNPDSPFNNGGYYILLEKSAKRATFKERGLRK